MTKRQIARKLVDTEAAIKLARKRLTALEQKAKDLAAELEASPVQSIEEKETTKIIRPPTHKAA